MIGSIRGEVTLKTDKFIVVETAGVGYKVNLSTETLSNLKTGEAFFWIYTHVREDSLELYGFQEREELQFFEMLINVSGIGPKGALGILGIASIENLRKAISAGETAYLTKISGIGRKTAEKIIIELRDKMGKITGETSLQGELDALEALRALGYSQNEAREALKQVEGDGDINHKIKEALKILGNK